MVKIEKSNIKDSGYRRTFKTGAVRDIPEGKGRTDLLPLHEVAGYMGKWHWPYTLMVASIAHAQDFINKEDYDTAKQFLYKTLRKFTAHMEWSTGQAVLELSKHFEQGAKKYGEHNWEKGIDFNSYIDSAVRHLLKHMDGQTDERHDRAFMWNIVCLIWTINNREVLNA